MPKQVPPAGPPSSRLKIRIQKAARDQRWASARRVLLAGLEILNHPEDQYLRGRFNQILDRINKQIAAGLSDGDIVVDAIARGSQDLTRLKDVTLLPARDLEAVLEELELAGRIRRVSRSTVEIRDKSKERAAVLRAMRAQTGPATLEDLRDATGYSRRHISQIMADLQAEKKVSRTRTGFLTAAVAEAARSGEHDDECLCRRCLTPRSQLAAAAQTRPNRGQF